MGGHGVRGVNARETGVVDQTGIPRGFGRIVVCERRVKVVMDSLVRDTIWREVQFPNWGNALAAILFVIGRVFRVVENPRVEPPAA